MKTIFLIIVVCAGSAKAQRCAEYVSAPAVFSPDVFSGEMRGAVTFSPDGRTALIEEFSSFDPASNKYRILVSELRKGVWTKPETAAFSGVYSDSKPFFAPDGKRVFFASNRPIPNNAKTNRQAKTDFDLWSIRRKGKKWASPVHLGARVNSEKDDLAPTVAADGTLYFSSARGGGMLDLYQAEFADGAYQPARAIGAVNTNTIENQPFVAPDERFLIFEASGRRVNTGSPAGDLYISCRKENEWQTPLNLGATLNSPLSDRAPFYDAQSGRLFFASNRSDRKLSFFAADFKRLAACLC